MDIYDFYIWKRKVADNDVRFLHISDLPNSGFSSVYGFSESDARAMENTESYASFKGVVSSPLLKVDCDAQEASETVEGWLKQQEIGYQKYTTGNRGHHYEINRLASPSQLLPSIDKAFVSRTFPGADISFYHHVGLYRLPGAIHQKTGRKKALLEHVEGRILDMTTEQADSVTHPFSRASNRGSVQCIFTDRILQNMTVPIAKGERHKRLCEVAVRLDTLNQPMEYAWAYIWNVNLMAEEPVEEGELRRMLHWAYEQRSK